MIGMWKVFKKFGKKGWLSLIPLVNGYKLGECVRRERDGFFMLLFTVIIRGLTVISAFVDIESIQYDILLITQFIFTIPMWVLSVRIYIGLVEAFGRKKRWAILFFFFDWFMLMLFGFSKKFMPLDDYVGDKHSDAELSNISLLGDGSGLSVNLNKRTTVNFFKKLTLLRDIHLTIPTGHMVLLLGGSGAGKTTFLNAVTGYEKADAEIKIGKLDVYKEYSRMKYDIGFVPQGDLMRDNDTVYRTIADAASLRLTTDMKPAEKRKRVEEVLDIFGLLPLKSSLVSKLSGGQRKRLSIAMEYISFPTLFILDEPDSGLDGVVARNLFEKLREIADTGKIVIVITHTPDRVIDLFDDVIVLAKDAERTGRLAYYGPVDEVYDFFGKESMENILLAINQKDEGGEGRAEEFVSKYVSRLKAAGGEA
ncbi:MAG TPA: ABC transporter ATP-binding protein [Ruminococcaceae bacterium]|nr:ABC transporter ATP-binding protein [Oscillospiraceae bacterium]